MSINHESESLGYAADIHCTPNGVRILVLFLIYKHRTPNGVRVHGTLRQL